MNHILAPGTVLPIAVLAVIVLAVAMLAVASRIRPLRPPPDDWEPPAEWVTE